MIHNIIYIKNIYITNIYITNIYIYIMLSIKIHNGLGNQLFKIISSLGFCEKYNKTLILSKNNIIENSHETKEQSITNIKTLFPDIDIVDYLDTTNFIKYRENCVYEYTNFNINMDICIDSSKHILLDGYFISEKYFSESLPNSVIYSINTIETVNTIKYKTLTNNFENTYFIHIRLGDYVNNFFYAINLIDYYNYCITKIKEQDSLAKFIICTNEHGANLDKYITNFPKEIDYIIQDLNNNALDTLYIMSSCKGGISSNSTLSLMGLYFQKEIQKHIETKKNTYSNNTTHKDYMYIPYPWCKYIEGYNEINTRDVYPTWVQLYDTINNKIIVL
jgi:hypothetical protein